MPLWNIYHPVGAYSAQDKKEFAEKVTAMYSQIPIPKFYVVMIFEEVAAESVYVGGASHGKFVRLKLEHMARTLPGPIIREWWVKAVDAAGNRELVGTKRRFKVIGKARGRHR